MILFRLSTRGRHKRYPPKFKNFGYRWIPGTEEISKDGLKSKTYQFQRKDRSRENRILSNTLVALRQFPRIRCLTRTLQGRHSFLSNFSLTAIDRSSHRCKNFRGLVDKPRNWYNFSIIFLLLLRIRRYSRRYILDKNRVLRSYLHLSYPGYRTIS